MRWSRGRVHVSLAVVMLLLPIVSAAAATVSFGLEGPVTFPADSEVSGPLLGLFHNGSESLRTLDIHGERAMLAIYSDRSVDVGNDEQRILSVVQPDSENVEFVNVSNFTIQTVAGAGTGWWGIFGAATTRATLRLPGESQVSAAERTSLGGSPLSPSGVYEDQDHFSLQIDTPHLVTSSSAVATIDGELILKLYGPDIVVRAHNTTEYRTGRASASGPVRTVDETWLVIRIPRGSLVLETDEPYDAALSRADVTWNGPLILQSAIGSVDAADAAYDSGSGPVVLDGAFTGTLLPSGGSGARLQADGDLAYTSAAVRTVRPTASGGVASWWPLGLAALAVVVAGGGAAYATLRRREPTYALDDCIEFASLAAENGDFERALEWTRRARALAPQSARLMLDEAFYLQETGRSNEALQMYETVAQRGESAEPDFLAALLLVGLSAPRDEVERHVLRALERDPASLVDFESDPRLAAVLAAPSLRQAVRRARGKLGA